MEKKSFLSDGFSANDRMLGKKCGKLRLLNVKTCVSIAHVMFRLAWLRRELEALPRRALQLMLGGGMLIAALSVTGGQVEPERRLPAKAVIQFNGTSTLHDFSGRLPAQPFLLILSNGTWSASADVLAGQMSTASEGRDGNMHKMLGTNQHPKIQGTVTAAPMPGQAGTHVMLRLKIRDQARELPARVSAWTESATEIKFHADWELSLKDYGLKPPSVIGVIRVGDRVKLQADVTASKSAPSPAPVAPP